MPSETKPSEQLVDIDTSGPGAEVDVAEKKDQEIVDIKEEQSNEETTQNDTSADDTSEKSDVSDDVQKSEQEKTQKDSELEDYSKGVQSRISKLTRKMREAERREAAALDYARAVENKRKEMESQFVKKDSAYNKKLEESVKTGMEAAQKELAAAIESGNAESQVEANKRIASLAFENAKLQQAKENACGCAGIYSSHAAIELYAEAFEAAGALDQLEGFASHFGADFYNLPRNKQTITLSKESWTVPESYTFSDETLIPMRASESIKWKVN